MNNSKSSLPTPFEPGLGNRMRGRTGDRGRGGTRSVAQNVHTSQRLASWQTTTFAQSAVSFEWTMGVRARWTGEMPLKC